MLRCVGFRCPEVCMQPSYVGEEASDVRAQSVRTHYFPVYDEVRWRNLYANVVPSGSTTKFTGVGERMTNGAYSTCAVHYED